MGETFFWGRMGRSCGWSKRVLGGPDCNAVGFSGLEMKGSESARERYYVLASDMIFAVASSCGRRDRFLWEVRWIFMKEVAGFCE